MYDCKYGRINYKFLCYADIPTLLLILVSVFVNMS